METIVALAKFLVENWQEILAAVIGLLTAIIGVALLIPGPQPETTLQKVVDFLSRFSRKPPTKVE